MREIVRPTAIDGTVAAPPSKSVMLRIAAAALLAEGGRTEILNPSRCEDARSGLRVAAALGAEVQSTPESVRITGSLAPRDPVLDCGESALCLRMFTAVAALSPRELTLTGTGSLLRRPTTDVERPLAGLGARCRTAGGLPPVTVAGPLRGGEVEVDGSQSSQFLSGLLLALPRAPRDSTLHVRNLASRPYVDLTLALLAECGIRVEREGHRRFFIPGGQEYRAGRRRVEGDWSAAAFLLVLGALGGRILVTGLDPASVQGDRLVLQALVAAGAGVEIRPEGVEVTRGDLRAFAFDVTDVPDLLPPLAALACHCRGETVLFGVSRVRRKECDRAEAVAAELTGLGARIEVRGDAMRITGGALAGGTARSHGDHRVAMAVAAAAVAARGPVAVEGAEHVSKSYPGFFRDLARVGGTVPVSPAGSGA